MLKKLDGNFSFNQWITADQIESGGGGSIIRDPIGRKLMLIAKPGRIIRLSEVLCISWTAVSDYSSKPPSKSLKNIVNFFKSSPDALTIQSALCSYIDVTAGDGPAAVVGFEGMK